MGWTFDASFTRPLDQVRALLGDIQQARPLIEDETILAVLLVQPNATAAAAAVAGVLAAEGGEIVRKTIGPITVQYQPRDFAALAAALTKMATAGGSQTLTPYAGGLSIAEKVTASQDPDLVRPVFTRPSTVADDPLRPRWGPV